MRNALQRKRRRIFICLGAMGITWLVMGILMAILGTAPFGDHSLAIADAKAQYLDFFHYYKDVLDGNNSIIYSLTNGMGRFFTGHTGTISTQHRIAMDIGCGNVWKKRVMLKRIRQIMAKCGI